MWKRLSRPARVFAVIAFGGWAALTAAFAIFLIGVVSSPRSRQTGRLLGYESFARPATVLAIVGLLSMLGGYVGLNRSAAFWLEPDGTEVPLRTRRAEAMVRWAETGRYRGWSRARKRSFWAFQVSAVVAIVGLSLLVFGLVGARRHADSGRVVTLVNPLVVIGVIVLAAGVAGSMWGIRSFGSGPRPSIVVVRSRSGRPFIVFVVVLAILAGAVAIVDTYATSRSSQGDQLAAAFVSPPDGFTEVPPRGPEDGPQDESQVAGLYAAHDEARDLLRASGFVTGWSRHWTNGGLENDSLVIRVDAFATADGAHDFAAPRSCCPSSASETSTTVVAVADARITSTVNPDLSSSHGYLGLPYAILGIGRVCNIVVTVFFRSRAGLHPDAEVNDLLTRESELVRPISQC